MKPLPNHFLRPALIALVLFGAGSFLILLRAQPESAPAATNAAATATAAATTNAASATPPAATNAAPATPAAATNSAPGDTNAPGIDTEQGPSSPGAMAAPEAELIGPPAPGSPNAPAGVMPDNSANPPE